MLEAVVDPEGSETTYFFEYGPEGADCDTPGACVKIGEGTVPAGKVGVPVSVKVLGLVAATKYHFRVIASSHCNELEPLETCVPVLVPEYLAFSTHAKTPPVVSGGSGSPVSQSEVTFEAKVNPGGFETTYFFEYGPEGSSCDTPGACVKVGEGTLPAGEISVGVSVKVPGLTPGAKYHFRAVAISKCSEADPSEECRAVSSPEYVDFSTLVKAPPVVGGLGVSEVGGSGVTLEGSVDPAGFATTYYFEYGVDGTNCNMPGACV